MLVLIKMAPAAIVSTFPEGTGRVDLPGVGSVSPANAGWVGSGYRIASIAPLEIPASKRRISEGPDGVELVSGEPMWRLEDIPPPNIEGLLAYAAAKKWQVETGGLTVGGASIDTSIDSQNRINGAYNYATANPGVLISFKAASGFVKLTSEQAIAIGQAVGAHVQACFAVEMAVAIAIHAGTITTTAEIDAADWPG